MYTLPAVGLSSPPIMLKNVLLPLPLGPMIDTYSPRSTLTVIPFRARTVSAPMRYSRVTSIARTAYSGAGASGMASNGERGTVNADRRR